MSTFLHCILSFNHSQSWQSFHANKTSEQLINNWTGNNYADFSSTFIIVLNGYVRLDIVQKIFLVK